MLQIMPLMLIKPRFFLFAMMQSCLTSSSYAAAVTDGTVGARSTLSGHFEIPQALGKTVGNNLFHSFSSFNINNNESATFTGADNIRQVFARVTGNDKSRIDGILTSTIAKADFYFINPNGVLFGAKAEINVPASFHVSTADEIRFKDGAVFNASLINNSSLTAATPEAYGFLTDRSSEIAFMGNGSIDNNHDWQGNTLTLNKGYTFELVGGKITIQGTQLITESGRFRLIAQQHAGVISLTDLLNKTDGDININNSWLDASGDGAGYSVLYGGTVNLNNSFWYSDNTGNTNALENYGIDAHATNLTLDDSRLTSDVGMAGDAGRVNIIVDNIMNATNNSQIHSSAQKNSTGNASPVSITARQLTLSDGAFISSNVRRNALGHAGTIRLNIADSLQLFRQAAISSSTRSKGNAGDVIINANNILIDQQNDDLTGDVTGIVSTVNQDINSATGHAGNIIINTENTTTLQKGGVIGTYTFDKGDAGTITLNSKNLIIDGQGMSDKIFTGINSNTYDKGNAGELIIHIANNLTLLDGGQINSATYYYDGYSTVKNDAIGKAGEISVDAKQIIIDGGFSKYTVKEFIASAISAKATESASGRVGKITIQARDKLHLTNGGQISLENNSNVTNVDSVKIGNINIMTPILIMDSQSEITSASSENIAASNIAIHASQWLTMQNSQITTSVIGTNGNGGNISISSPVILLNTGFIQANSAAKNGEGGLININSSALIPSGNTLHLGGENVLKFKANQFGYNVIQATAPTGINGDIYITSPQLNLSAVLANLSAISFEHRKLLQDFCHSNNESYLTKLGHGGLLNNTDVLGF